MSEKKTIFGILNFFILTGAIIFFISPFLSFLRHPGYFSSILTMSGFPLLLDSLWAFFPILLIVISTVIRTYLEDRALTSGLPGFQDYTVKVRYRLFPGIW